MLIETEGDRRGKNSEPTIIKQHAESCSKEEFARMVHNANLAEQIEKALAPINDRLADIESRLSATLNAVNAIDDAVNTKTGIIAWIKRLF